MIPENRLTDCNSAELFLQPKDQYPSQRAIMPLSQYIGSSQPTFFMSAERRK
jgi:hypothetical protein